MSANLDGYNTPRRSTLKSKLEKRIEALEVQVAMKKDVKDTVDWILSEFSLAEADQIRSLISEHLNWYIETTNNQDWEQ
tara:strand:+ start:194 stop:430 length:237 start_codon:yes stop_codon:yes gene_type:complete